MRLVRSSALALGLASAANAQAQFLVGELSFGYTGRINDRGQTTVPGFSLQGTPDTPEILSNKLILTPPAPGNTRGAVWADQPNPYAQWVVDVDFRVNGPERGTGNLNIWLARGGSQEIGSSSIYTIGKFDGLALVIDQHGGSGGMMRGFLNDGTTDYKTHQSVDSLAFGHCNYAYRNLGRPSQIKLRQSAQGFRVEIDNRLCFESDQITLPPGYHFGITAAAADNPDSFEVFKLVTMTENLDAKAAGTPPPPRQQQQQGQDQAQAQMSYGRGNQNSAPAGDSFGDSLGDVIPDTSADIFTSSAAQFADLHNRLQGMQHHLLNIHRSVGALGGRGSSEQASPELGEIKELLAQNLQKLDKLESLTGDVGRLQRDVGSIRNELNNKLKDAIKNSENSLKSFIGSNHGSMLEHVATQSTSRHGTLLFIIVASQVVLVAGYVYYERRQTLPKKYL
ncbi:concanavalin A-like lectin/glucanase [Xylariaceae sp. FL0804]|nr:concanavalin A-like lectin/glucanase [Xylariaceae sp. FL0804]